MQLLHAAARKGQESEVNHEAEGNEVRSAGGGAQGDAQVWEEFVRELSGAFRATASPCDEARAGLFGQAGPALVSGTTGEGIHREILQRGESRTRRLR